MKKVNKKVLLTSILVPITVAAVVPGISLSIAKIVEANSIYNINSAKYNNMLQFDGSYFESQSDLIEYANKITQYSRQEQRKNIRYTVKNDLDIKELSADALDSFLNERIKVYDVNSSIIPEKGLNGSINPDNLKFMNGSENSSKKVTIYRGKNNSIHLSENAAKDTYFEVHDVYFYKNTYFPSKDHLKNYLKDTQNEWWDAATPKSIVLRAPNGQISDLIQISDLKALNSKAATDDANLQTRIKDFIRVNAINNMEYRKSDTKKLWYDKTTIGNFANDYVPNYIYVQSNGGAANYIIDAAAMDNIGVNGPYFATTSGSIANITDRNLWQETTVADRLDTAQYDNVQILSKFLDSALGMSSDPSSNTVISNKFFKLDAKSDADKKLQEDIDQYYYDIAKDEPDIYASISNTYEQMKKGKRYNSFYKIPILFYQTLDQIVYWKAPQKLADRTRDIFERLCDYYDRKLDALVPTVQLWNTGSTQRQIFSMKNIFHITEKNLDLNLDPESIVAQIIDDYPELLKVAKAVPIFVAHRSLLGSGVDNFEFSIDFYNKHYGLNLDPKFEFFYKQLWQVCSTSNKTKLDMASTFMYVKNYDLSDWTFDYSLNGIADFYNSNFNEQWKKSLILDEAIRYALTKDRFVYSNDQLNYLQFLDFMAKPEEGDSENTNIDNYSIWESNLQYMRDLYTLNGNEIENIFYIIVSIYSNLSYNNSDGKTLEEMFGPVKTYNDKEYSSKIFEKFQNEIMSDMDKLTECTNNVFAVPISEIATLAEQYGYETVKETEMEIDESLGEQSQLINYPENFPDAYSEKSRGSDTITYNEIKDSTIDPKYLKVVKKAPDGKPHIYLKTKSIQSRGLLEGLPDNTHAMSLANPYNNSVSTLTLGEIRHSFKSATIDNVIKNLSDIYPDVEKDLNKFSQYLGHGKDLMTSNLRIDLALYRSTASFPDSPGGVNNPEYIRVKDKIWNSTSEARNQSDKIALANFIKNETIQREESFKTLKAETDALNKSKAEYDQKLDKIEKEHQEALKKIESLEKNESNLTKEEFEREKAKIEKDYNDKIGSLKKEYDPKFKEFDEKIKAQQKKIDKNETLLKTNQTKIEAAKTSINKLEGQVAANTKTIDEHGTLIQKNSGDISRLEAEVTGHTESIADLQRKNMAIDAQLEQLRKDHVTNSTRIQELETSKIQNDKIMSEHKASIDKNTEDISKLKKKNKKYEDDINSLKNQNIKTNLLILNNKLEIDEQQIEINEIKRRLDTEKNDYDLLKREQEGLLEDFEFRRIEQNKHYNQLRVQQQEKYNKKIQKISNKYDGEKRNAKLEKLNQKFLVDKDGGNSSLNMKIDGVLKKQKVLGILKKVGTAIGVIGGVVAGIFMILEMISSFEKTEQVSYTYTNKDLKLTWDGGSRTTRWFGLQQGPTTGIDQMKMLDPIQIIRPNTNSGYYYNGHIYSTENEIRNKQAKDLLSGEYTNEDVYSSYSFERISNESLAPKYSSKTLSDLVDTIYNELISEASKSKPVWPSFVEEREFSLDEEGIYVINKDKTQDENIKAIVDNIKPIKIAYLPFTWTEEILVNGKTETVDTGVPISKDYEYDHDDKSIPNYEVPFSTYDTINKKIVKKEVTAAHVKINPNDKANENKTTDQLITELKNSFFEKLNIPSTEVFENDLVYKHWFSQLDRNYTISSYKVYEAKGSYNDTRFFIDENDAKNYLFGSYGIEIVYDTTMSELYMFRNNIFYSKQDYLNWISKNVEVI